MTTHPSFLPFDEAKWIVRIRRILDDEEIELCDDDQPISIFDVPKALLSTKPEAYTPQVVSLGPYHHCREELCDMERHKLSAAKGAQIDLPGMDLQHLVQGFMKLENRIRAHYHRHLNLSNEALGWMMAIDVSFLLEFLLTFSKNNDKRSSRQMTPSRSVAPSRRTSSSRSALLRDVVMLENQVPLFLLLEAIECRHRCSARQQQGPAQSVLARMLTGFFQEVSMFRGLGCPRADGIDRHFHLLDFIYSTVVPRCAEANEDEDEAQDESRCKHDDHRKRKRLHAAVDFLARRGSKLVAVLVELTVRVLARFVASLPCLSVLSHPIEELTQQACSSAGPADATAQSKQSLSSPLMEEIAVPCVTELAYAGVRFCPAVGGLSAVAFCADTATLHLPVIGVDASSEVLLRNLVAYEAATASDGAPLALARYVELMNGIVDTEDDARALRECGVILNHLKSDAEVAELWNGMTRSVRLTRVPALDRVIDDLNRHYAGCWKVKVRSFVRARVLALGSRELLGFVAVVTLLLFMGLQVLCVARGCVPASYGMASRKLGA